MSEHSPLPWVLDVDEDGDLYIRPKISEAAICWFSHDVDSRFRARPNGRANAEYIVQACNAYPSLTADLAETRKELCAAQKRIGELEAGQVITKDTSDGYHTFGELYDYRRVYNALLFNEWAKLGLYDVHKSWRHSDGESCFGGGWFIVVANLPHGQISNHYEAEFWDEFQIPERDLPAPYDGHTPRTALARARALLSKEVE